MLDCELNHFIKLAMMQPKKQLYLVLDISALRKQVIYRKGDVFVTAWEHNIKTVKLVRAIVRNTQNFKERCGIFLVAKDIELDSVLNATLMWLINYLPPAFFVQNDFIKLPTNNEGSWDLTDLEKVTDITGDKIILVSRDLKPLESVRQKKGLAIPCLRGGELEKNAEEKLKLLENSSCPIHVKVDIDQTLLMWIPTLENQQSDPSALILNEELIAFLWRVQAQSCQKSFAFITARLCCEEDMSGASSCFYASYKVKNKLLNMYNIDFILTKECYTSIELTGMNKDQLIENEILTGNKKCILYIDDSPAELAKVIQLQKHYPNEIVIIQCHGNGDFYAGAGDQVLQFIANNSNAPAPLVFSRSIITLNRQPDLKSVQECNITLSRPM